MKTQSSRPLYPLVFIALVWLSILPGQLLRWQPNGFGTAGILATDIIAVLALPVALYLFIARRALWRDWGVRLLLLWLAIIFLSFLVGVIHYGKHDALLAAGYVLRLVAYCSTFIVALHLGAEIKNAYLRYAALSVIVLFIFGLLVMRYIPDFAVLAPLGWDPHVGRLTSTWLDPNYFGSFIALVYAGALCFENELFSTKKYWIALQLFLLLCLVAMYLTISRSAIVTLAVAGIFASFRTSWRAVVILVVSLILLFVVPSRLQNRLASSVSYVGSATSEVINGSTNSSNLAGTTSSDPTAGARLLSWKRAWELSKHSPILGVGYNYYEPALVKYGLITANGETRGTTGSDSSLLTLLATAGWLGLLSTIAFFLYLAYVFFRARGVWPTIGLAVLAGMAVGSQLNNLLLYPLVLLPFMVTLGLAYFYSRSYEHA